MRRARSNREQRDSIQDLMIGRIHKQGEMRQKIIAQNGSCYCSLEEQETERAATKNYSTVNSGPRLDLLVVGPFKGQTSGQRLRPMGEKTEGSSSVDKETLTAT